jgi:N-acetylneuraminate synthase
MTSTFIIAEIGINHNGDMNIVKKLIDEAAAAGCDAVKFQKRTLELVYSEEELDKPRESPWGKTNREQKRGLELTKEDYDEIDECCRSKGVQWFASAWDLESQKFLRQYDLNYNKVASALLTYRELLEEIASEGKHTFISTGMSTLEQIDQATQIFDDANCPYELMHTNSTYPMNVEDANLRVMDTLRSRYGCNVGYSGHESGIIVSCAAVSRSATSLERHITLDRAMYGSDQAASLEIAGLRRLVSYVRDIEQALGSPVKKVMKTEVPIAKKLRKYNTL